MNVTCRLFSYDTTSCFHIEDSENTVTYTVKFWYCILKFSRESSKDEVDTGSSACDIYSEDDRFESRPGYRVSLLRFFLVFLSPMHVNFRTAPQTGPPCLVSKLFPIHYLPEMLLFGADTFK
jgi:hypothetical protein